MIAIPTFDTFILRHSDKNLYSIESIAQFCNTDTKNVMEFIHSDKFNMLVHNITGNSYKYACYINKGDCYSVSDTYQLDRNKSVAAIESELVNAVCIDNADVCKNKLINKFTGKYGAYTANNEFIVKDNGIELFNAVTSKYKHKLSRKTNDINSIESALVISKFTDMPIESALKLMNAVEKSSMTINRNDNLYELNGIVNWNFCGQLIRYDTKNNQLLSAVDKSVIPGILDAYADVSGTKRKICETVLKQSLQCKLDM